MRLPFPLLLACALLGCATHPQKPAAAKAFDPINPATKIGYLDPASFKFAADTALQFGLIKQPAEEAAYTHAIWELATK